MERPGKWKLHGSVGEGGGCARCARAGLAPRARDRCAGDIDGCQRGGTQHPATSRANPSSQMLLRRRLSWSLPQLPARRCLCGAATPLARHGSQVAGSRRDSASTPRPPGSRLSPTQRAELVDRIDTFLFDCDGVIWRGDTIIDGVPETLEMLRRKGKHLIFLTNNSTKSRAGYEAKFRELGIAVTAEEIFASSFAAAAYLTSRSFSPEGKVYVVGEAGIQQELDLAGIQHLGGPDDASKHVDMGPGGVLEIDPAVKAVVVGLDRDVNYYKIQYATQCVRELGAEVIATNRDAV